MEYFFELDKVCKLSIFEYILIFLSWMSQEVDSCHLIGLFNSVKTNQVQAELL